MRVDQENLQRWLGLLVAVGALGVFIQAGRALGRIEEKVDFNYDRASGISGAFVEHVKTYDEGQRDIARLIRDLDGRVAHIEGREEERDIRRQGG